jgi:hypothetical protein
VNQTQVAVRSIGSTITRFVVVATIGQEGDGAAIWFVWIDRTTKTIPVCELVHESTTFVGATFSFIGGLNAMPTRMAAAAAISWIPRFISPKAEVFDVANDSPLRK